MSLSGTFQDPYSRVKEHLKRDPQLLIRTKQDVIDMIDRGMTDIGLKRVKLI